MACAKVCCGVKFSYQKFLAPYAHLFHSSTAATMRSQLARRAFSASAVRSAGKGTPLSVLDPPGYPTVEVRLLPAWRLA